MALRARSHRARQWSRAAIRTVDETELLALAPSHLLVGTFAASPATAVVPAGTGDLLDELSPPTSWLLAGVGHVLPARLFSTLDRAVSAADDLGVEQIDLARFDRVAGPIGLDPPDAVSRRVDCPVAPELLRLGG